LQKQKFEALQTSLFVRITSALTLAYFWSGRTMSSSEGGQSGVSERLPPQLVIVRYWNDVPTLCSVCREAFSVLSVPGVYVGFKDILSVFQEHCRARHSAGVVS
jgi:hypothetical protein